ncbi:MAG: DM13 domain-containing protein [Pseudomonadota bacterium]
MKKALLLAATHAVAAAIGFAAGIYLLPILIAPGAPSAVEVESAAANAEFRGRFRRDLKGSDFLHWGEGTVSVSRSAISLAGRVAPGPDYKLYLSPEFVETRDDFARLKPRMARVGDVKTFENFIVAVPPGIDPRAYNTVVVWCETFGMFISAAQYKF